MLQLKPRLDEFPTGVKYLKHHGMRQTFDLFFFSDILSSFSRVITNGTYMVLTVSGTCSIFLIISLFMQMTKYLQIQFQVSPTKASLIVGKYYGPAAGIPIKGGGHRLVVGTHTHLLGNNPYTCSFVTVVSIIP